MRRGSAGAPAALSRAMDAVLPFDAMPEPPGKKPIVGHLTEWLGKDNATRVLERILGYAEHCGPVARISLGPARMVVIGDAEVASSVLADPRANYKGASYTLTRAVLDNVLLQNGGAWEKNRGLYRKALKNVDAVGAAREVTSAFASSLRGEVRLDEEVFRLVGNIAGRFVAGVTITEAFEPHRARIQYELAAIGIDLLCQPWTYLSPLRWAQMRRSVRRARRFFRAAVDRRLAGERADAHDVMSGFMALARAGEYPNDPAAITDGCVNFFFTAHDVLASSAAWMLHLISKHEGVQSKLRASLARPDGDAELERVVKEALRLFPGYGLFGRTTQEEMEIGGYRVPRGTLIIASPFVTHRLERHWPNALAFDPDRWLGKQRGRPAPTARDQYMPFGSGARACLASHLAFPILETIAREVVSRVSLRADPAHDPGILYWGTSYARHGMPVQVERVAPPVAHEGALA
jgi:cytochrome P450